MAHLLGLERDLGARARAPRWVVDHGLVLAAGLAAALPIIVATVRVVVDRWTPLGDDALIAVHAFDVFSAHPPLVGMPSTGPTGVLAEPSFHLGPLLFWVLAVPARFLGPSSLPVTIGLIGIACVMGSVALAQRRGGPGLMLAVAVSVPLMLASLPPETLADVWNPSSALMPFLLVMFLGWSLACGEYRLLPLTVFLGSFVVQCHLIYILPVAGSLGVGVVGLALWARGHGERRLWRWVAAAAAVAVFCWSGPAIDQAFHSPGNIHQLVRAARAKESSLGYAVGARSVVHTIGIPPWWLRDQRGPLQRIADLDNTPGPLAVGSAALVLLGLAGAFVVALRRRRHDVAAGSALALVICAAVGLAPASVPSASYASLGYGLWWASPAGMFVWLVLGWSIAALAGKLRLPAQRRLAGAPVAGVAVAGVAVAAAVGCVVAVRAHPPHEPFREMRAISSRLDDQLRQDRPLRVDAAYTGDTVFVGGGFQLGIVYSALRDGLKVAAPSLPDLGSRYGVRRPGEQVVRVDVDRAPPARGRTIADFEVSTDTRDNPFAAAPPRRVVVTLIPPPAAR